MSVRPPEIPRLFRLPGQKYPRQRGPLPIVDPGFVAWQRWARVPAPPRYARERRPSPAPPGPP